MATLKNGERRMMSDLKIGDSILAVDHLGNFIFSPIILFLQKDPEILAQFYNVQTESGQSLEISRSHLVYIRPQNRDKNKLVTNQSESFFVTNNEKLEVAVADQLGSFSLMFASSVKVGDELLVHNGNDELALTKVKSVKPTIVNGAYAPLTLQGNLVVNDIASSCYASYDSHNIVHALFAPFRWWHEISKYLPHMFVGTHDEEMKEAEGIHWYARALKSMGKYLDMIPSQPSME